MSDQTPFKVYETRTVLKQVNTTGSGSDSFYVVSGSRMLVTLLVTSIDLGAQVNVFIDNNFDTDESDDTVLTLSTNSVSRVKRVLTDFHNQFTFRYVVTGGNATFKVGVSLFDNAMTTRIDNAIVEVDLHHTTDVNGEFDSVRLGDGTNLLVINPDGSINTALPAGAATEAKQDAGNAILADISTSSDSIDAGVTAANLTLTQIANNTDQIESKLDDVVQAIQDQEPIKISGTSDGTPTGTEYVFVNNRRLQILAASDRQQHITYADFGTKDQRVTQIDYTASSIGSGPGFTASKIITYTLVGVRYRRDDIDWTLV